MQEEKNKTITRDLVVFVVIVSILFFVKYPIKMSDFEVYYLAGERILAGENVYNLNDALEFKYLPATALLFSIFSLIFTLSVAKVVWYIVNAVLIFFTLFSSVKLVKGRYDSKIFYFALLIFMFLFARELLLGQVNLLMIWLVLLAINQLRVSKEAAAGILLGVSIFIKPYSLIFLPYLLVRKNYKAFLFSTFVVLLGLGVPFLLGVERGVGLYFSCFELLDTTSNELYSSVDNVSIWSFYYKLLNDLTLSKIFSLITIAVIYLFFLISVHRKKTNTPQDYVIEGAVLLALIPLFSPQGWYYQFVTSSLTIITLMVYFNQLSTAIKILFIALILTIPLSLSDVSGKVVSRWMAENSILTISFTILIFLSYSLRKNTKTEKIA